MSQSQEFGGSQTQATQSQVISNLTDEARRRMVTDLVRATLFKEQRREPITDRFIAENITAGQKGRGAKKDVITTTNRVLNNIFGFELVDAPHVESGLRTSATQASQSQRQKSQGDGGAANSKKLYLLNALSQELTEGICTFRESEAAPKGLIMITLSIIFLNCGGSLNERFVDGETFWERMRVLGLSNTRAHPMLGDIDGSVKRMAKDGYIVKAFQDEKHGYKIGPRAITEIGVANLARFFHELHDKPYNEEYLFDNVPNEDAESEED